MQKNNFSADNKSVRQDESKNSKSRRDESSCSDTFCECSMCSLNCGRLSRLRMNVNPVQNQVTATTSVEKNDDIEVPLCLSSQSQNWQSSKTAIKERIAFMFNNEILADVHFIVGKGSTTQRIPAHKFVLSIGSAVFDAMFNGVLATQSSEIEIPDVEPAAFFALLRFLYSDRVLIDPETVMTMLYAAKKYAVPALEAHCVEFLQTNLTPDNAFMLLSQARLFDEAELATMCLKTIDKDTNDALTADGFTDVDLDTLCCVLSRDSLRIKEAKLFQAVIRWSAEECERQGLPVTTENQRSVLGRGLMLIRFPLMTMDEFAGGAAQSGLLTDKEVVSLFLYFTVNPKPAIDFTDTPRGTMPGNELVMNRFSHVGQRWGYTGPSDRIRFIVDHQIYILGFGLYGSVYIPAEYTVHIELIHTPTNKVLGSNDTTFSSDGSVSVFRIMFEEPIQVLPNNSYTASARIKGLDSHYGTKGARKVQIDTPIGKVTFQFSSANNSANNNNNNGSTVEEGQIPQIYFYT